MSPLLDVLITLLHWGSKGWQRVLQQREDVYRCTLPFTVLLEPPARSIRRRLYTMCKFLLSMLHQV